MSKKPEVEEQEEPKPVLAKKKATAKKATSKKTGSKKAPSKKTSSKKGPTPQRTPAESSERPNEELWAPPVERPDLSELQNLPEAPQPTPQALPTPTPTTDAPEAQDALTDPTKVVLDQLVVQATEAEVETKPVCTPTQPPSRRELSRRRRGDRRRKTPARELRCNT